MKANTLLTLRQFWALHLVSDTSGDFSNPDHSLRYLRDWCRKHVIPTSACIRLGTQWLITDPQMALQAIHDRPRAGNPNWGNRHVGAFSS